MTLGQIKSLVMFQTNNDSEDVGDFMPALTEYINEGYDKLVCAYTDAHLQPTGEEHRPLSWDNDVPNLPEHMHKALADWATWCVYRNGNPQKQQRGYVFRSAFEEALAAAQSGGSGDEPAPKNFYNIPW